MRGCYEPLFMDEGERVPKDYVSFRELQGRLQSLPMSAGNCTAREM
jgi:hypothetical protein